MPVLNDIQTYNINKIVLKKDFDPVRVMSLVENLISKAMENDVYMPYLYYFQRYCKIFMKRKVLNVTVENEYDLKEFFAHMRDMSLYLEYFLSHVDIIYYKK